MELLALYSPDARLLPRVRAALGAARPVTQCHSWSALERTAARAACMVAVLEWLRGEELVARLSGLSRSVPATPLILVTAKDPDAVRQLSRTVIAEILWPHEIERGLQAAVSRAMNRTPVERLADRLDTAWALPARMRLAMVRALRASRPPATVEEAAALAGCDRRTLWRQGREVLGAGLRLQDVFDWIVLLKVSGERAQGRKWAAIAQDLGLHEHTIGRSIRRLTDLSLGDFAALGQSELQRRFEDQVLGRLLLDGGDVAGPALAGNTLNIQDQ